MTTVTAIALPTFDEPNIAYLRARHADAMHSVQHLSSPRAFAVAYGQFLAYSETLYLFNLITSAAYHEYLAFADARLKAHESDGLRPLAP
jgi:hypothetical protein